MLAVNVEIEGKVWEPCDGDTWGPLDTASHGLRLIVAVSIFVVCGSNEPLQPMEWPSNDQDQCSLRRYEPSVRQAT